MTLCYVAASLYEKPSSSYREACHLRSIVTAFFLILMCVVHGCKSILHSGSKLPAHPSANSFEFRYDGGCTGSPFSNRSQCLYFNSQFSENICNISKRLRRQELGKYHLKFCSDYTVYQVIPDQDVSNEIEDAGCLNYLQKIIFLDLEIAKMYEEFKEIMFKFDCSQTKYSVKWTCVDCETAYRKWLCSSHIDLYHACYYSRNTPVPPCPHTCMEVERKCPFFRPNTSYAQAGDPSFICKDRDIYQEESYSSCYKDCHLRSDKCEFPCNTEETTNSSPSTIINESTDSSKMTPQSNSSERLAPRKTSTLLIVVLYVLNMCVVRTLLQYLSIGWT